MILELILLFCWMIYCLTQARRDANFYHYKSIAANPDKSNLHWLFAVERFIVLSLIFIIYYNGHSIINTTLFISGLVLIFSFIHNGYYFTERNRLDQTIYKERFWADSLTSTAKLEFNVHTRTILFAIGIVSIMASFLTFS